MQMKGNFFMPEVMHEGVHIYKVLILLLYPTQCPPRPHDFFTFSRAYTPRNKLRTKEPI